MFVYVKFWRIKAEPSTLVTAWRVFKNNIATKANLERRGVEEESCRHSFFKYRTTWLV